MYVDFYSEIFYYDLPTFHAFKWTFPKIIFKIPELLSTTNFSHIANITCYISTELKVLVNNLDLTVTNNGNVHNNVTQF